MRRLPCHDVAPRPTGGEGKQQPPVFQFEINRAEIGLRSGGERTNLDIRTPG